MELDDPQLPPLVVLLVAAVAAVDNHAVPVEKEIAGVVHTPRMDTVDDNDKDNDDDDDIYTATTTLSRHKTQAAKSCSVRKPTS